MTLFKLQRSQSHGCCFIQYHYIFCIYHLYFKFCTPKRTLTAAQEKHKQKHEGSKV